MRKVLNIGLVNLLRFLRDRSNIFFVFIFPVGLIFILGLSFGGSGRAQLGVVAPDGEFTGRLISELESGRGLQVVRLSSSDSLRDQVERGGLVAGLLVPDDFESALTSGQSVDIEFLTASSGAGMQMQLPVMAAIGSLSERVKAASFVAGRSDLEFDGALRAVDGAAGTVPDFVVRTERIGDNPFGEDIDAFDLSAASQLVLFMFLTGMAAAGALIQSRQMGVSRRMLSTPTSVLTIVVGEGWGRFVVALFQGVYIMAATWLLFGVDWGDAVGAVLMLMMFAAVAAGAGMLMGAVFDNDQQAGGIAVVLGLGLAAIGGAMVPLELFGPTMRTIAKFTPHSWAVDGFGELLRHGGGVTDIWLQLLVLAGFAIALLGLAAWRLRLTLLRG